MKYCRLQTKYGAQYGEVVDRDGRMWIERLILPFEEGPASDFVDPASDPFDPLPLDEARIRAGLAGLRGASLLFGGRGRPGVDVDALVALARSIGEVFVERPLELVECNPVLVGQRGAVALDAVVRLRRQLDEPESAR